MYIFLLFSIFFWSIYTLNNTIQFIFYISNINNCSIYFTNLHISYLISVLMILMFIVILYKTSEFHYFYIYSKIEIDKFTWLHLKKILSTSYNILFFILFIIL